VSAKSVSFHKDVLKRNLICVSWIYGIIINSLFNCNNNFFFIFQGI